jgi:DNA polymerase III epsilon subunit-like protein
MKLLVVDIETTGFYANSDAIVEIGIALVDTDTKEIELVFDNVIKHKKFNTKRHKDSWIFQNTTLTVQDVENAKTLESYQTEIQGLFDKYKMTAYNKSFDVRFLTAAGFKMDEVKCLMQTATQYSTFKDKNGKIKKPSVEEIYNQFFMTDGEIYVEEHRAGADAKDEAKILLHMVGLKGSKTLVVEDKKTKKKVEKVYKPLDVDDVITFGKHKGKTVSYVINEEAWYLNWCLTKIPQFSLTPNAMNLLNKKSKNNFVVKK